MRTRLDLLALVPADGDVCEVGVMAGDFAKQIVDSRPDVSYTGVDSWQGRFEQFFPYVQAWAAKTHGARIIKADSRQAARDLAKAWEQFDLVYIDALHTREAVLADLKAWRPLVRRGGILAGHDYEAKPAEAGWEPIEVKEAVDLWAATEALTVNVIQEPAPTWWIRL